MSRNLLLAASLAAALAAGPVLAQTAQTQAAPTQAAPTQAAPTQTAPLQGGIGTSGGTSAYDSSQGTATAPNRLQPATSASPGVPLSGQGAPAATPGGTDSALSTGGQIRPGSPNQGGGTGGSSR